MYRPSHSVSQFSYTGSHSVTQLYFLIISPLLVQEYLILPSSKNLHLLDRKYQEKIIKKEKILVKIFTNNWLARIGCRYRNAQSYYKFIIILIIFSFFRMPDYKDINVRSRQPEYKVMITSEPFYLPFPYLCLIVIFWSSISCVVIISAGGPHWNQYRVNKKSRVIIAWSIIKIKIY